MLGSHSVNPRPKFTLPEKQRSIRRSDTLNIGLGQAAPTHADDIEANQICERPMSRAVRNDVGAHSAQAHNHGAFADADELPYRYSATEHDVVANLDVTPRRTLLANTTSFPILQSCATCAPTMKKQLLPTSVTPPPSSLPVFIVTFSRMSQSAPITNLVGPPR